MSRGYIYRAGPIEFRARGLDEANRIARRLDWLLREELGSKAEGYVSLGRVEASRAAVTPTAERPCITLAALEAALQRRAGSLGATGVGRISARRRRRSSVRSGSRS